MTIPEGDARHYRVAQIDDYSNLARKKFPARIPLTMRLRARVSTNCAPGTWGFGLWNDPFGLSVGFGGNPFHLPVLPNAIWFFHASQENYLSFRDYPETSRQTKTGGEFFAQTFESPGIPSALLMLVGAPALLLLAARRTSRFLRKIVSRLVHEERLCLDIDVTEWHSYKFEWHPTRSTFWLDDRLLLETPVTPRAPLGLVIWIDNQWAAWRPDGAFGWGLLPNENAWLELADISLT